MSVDYRAKTEELYRAMNEITDPDQRLQIRNRIIDLTFV